MIGTRWLAIQNEAIATFLVFFKLMRRERERERDMTPIVGVGLNEGHFTLVIVPSSYVNPERVD